MASSEGEWVAGKPHGFHVTRRSDGSWGEYDYVNGVLHGMWVNYYSNGVVEIEQPFVNGLQHGTRIERRRDGTFFRRMRYVNGEMIGNIETVE